MTTNLNKPTTPTVIKWTDAEWELIAKQLSITMGPALLSSRDLSEVKAKDVFRAQENALPEERHRKLISISQGFQAIRQRLKPLLSNAADTGQSELFHAKANQVGDNETSAHNVEPEIPSNRKATLTSTEVPTAAHYVNRVDTLPTDKNTAVVQSTSQSDVPVTTHISALAGSPGAVASCPVVATTVDTVENLQAAANIDNDSQRHRPSRDPRPSGPNAGYKPAREPAKLKQNHSALPAADFNKVVHPFIAMVCEELARALVNAVSLPENTGVLSAILRHAMPAARDPEQNKTGNNYATPRNNEQHRPNVRQDSPVSEYVESVSNGIYTGTADDDDMDNDVQPLFDPKLPPSPNSTFKPVVGVVGASAQDFNDLQQMYPQLMLTAIAVDDVPNARALEQCQRVIGLREDVPAKTDEILRYRFRSRYLRLTGGMGRVREQLDVWLDKPGATEQARLRFNKPRNNKGPANKQKNRPANFSRPPR